MAKQFKGFLRRYFYFSMSLLIAALVVWGFSHTVDANLLHANPPRPLLLWVHGAIFSAWLVFYVVQSALVRAQKVSVHRFLGWFGGALAAVMVALGFAIAVIMARFDGVVLHQADADAFLSIPFWAISTFGACMALAIYWRKRPEYHRRLIFLANCGLLAAGLDRFDFVFYHNLAFPILDLLIVLGMVRDWSVDRRVHKVYFYGLPLLIVAQSLAVFAWRVNPRWWQVITHAILGS
jgi:FtsH-binding integral membrane protein